MLKQIGSVLTLSTLLLLSSCSDLFKTDVVKKDLQPSTLRVDCDLDIDQFSHILSQNISGTISCLGDNLKLFMKLDETSQPGYVSHKSLVQYLRKNEPSITEKGYRIIETIFNLNYLIYGESKEMVSKPNLDGLINLTLVLNREAALIYDVSFGSTAPGTYATQLKQRERVHNAVAVIRAALLKIYRPDRGERRINLFHLIESFTTNQDTINKLTKLIFLKSTLLGGLSEQVTSTELTPLIDSLPLIGQIALDLIRYEYLTLNQNEEMLLLGKDLELLEGTIFNGHLGDRTKEEFFYLRQAFDGVLALMKDSDLEYDKMKNLLIEAKVMLMGGEPETVTGEDLQRVIAHGKNIARMGQQYYRFYNSDALFSKLEGKAQLNLDIKDYLQLFPLEVDNLKDFIRIANTYRFQRSNGLPAVYAPGWFRNTKAMFGVGLVEYVLKIFMNRHGVVSTGVGGKSMDAKDITKLVKIYETELMDLEVFLPRKAESTANTISLLGSLFQYQSDNNSLLDVNEAAEFVDTYITSSAAGKKMLEFYKEPAQGCTIDQFDRVEPACFRQHFFRGVCEMYKENFPSMMKYLGTDDCSKIPSTELNLAFLDMSIRANKTCMVYPGTEEEIYYSQSDIMSTILVLMHIETTILRWDINGNNFMDENEVLNAYPTYRPAIEGMLPPKYPILKKFAKQVFQYLIRFEKAPDVPKSWKEVTNLIDFLFRTPRTRPADRKTIAAVLKAVGDQSLNKTPVEQQFKCEWLRDPDHIPRDP
jgi:hypothetical protein